MELLIGAIVTIIIQFIKKLYKLFIGEDWHDLAVLITLLFISFIGAAAIYALKRYGLWETFYEVALSAAGIWAIFVRRLEKLGEPS